MSEDQEHPLTDQDLVELYAASSQIEADRIVLMLGEEGIEAHAREASVAGFPSDANRRHLITVFGKDRGRAVELVQAAVDADVLTDKGTFLS